MRQPWRGGELFGDLIPGEVKSAVNFIAGAVPRAYMAYHHKIYALKGSLTPYQVSACLLSYAQNPITHS